MNLNMLGILVAFIGVYVYFVATFDIAGLFKNLVNLIVDLTVMFSGLPLLVWIVIASILLNIIRKHIGMKRLKNNELKNRAFIKDKLSLVNLICGFMRSGKNLTETDIALSAEMIHKDMALEGMVNEWYKLPDFPFYNLEKEIERAVMFGEIKDLPTARVFASKKRERFLKNICPEKLFGYDTSRYSTEFDNGMYVETVFDIIETYTQLYLMYCVDTSLIVSNYSVRSGAIKDDNGHFPLWNEDFFDAPSLIEEMYDGNYSHIIDYDMFRLGRRVNENSEVGLFGYGIALMSEKGKERGNAVENQCYKKDDYRANPKNDYFNLFLKVIAHGATVDYQTFALVLGDEQRPESVGADEREISTLVHILNRDKDMLAMPFFELEELAYMFFRNHFDNFIKQYRYHRSDETLFMYLLKSCIHRFYSFYKRTYGIYGYDVVKLGLEKGIMDGNIEEHKYYIANHKTKARRYSTDCYRNMLAEKAKVGLNDLPTYRGVQGDGDEMYEQNSFFVNEFKKHLQD